MGSIISPALPLPMPVFRSRVSTLATVVVACAAAAGCGTFDGATQRIAGSITPYRVEVVQGNFVSREQVQALQPGMSRLQVREVLGTPLVTSIFHADRWDYVFTLKRQGVQPQSRRLTVFFKGDVLERFEGDEMPSEAEFVATLDTRRKAGRIPVLEVSEENLKPAPARTAAPQEPLPLPPPASYPPLEPAGR
jgi:outer membrane protein assembly factor BamE